MSENINEMNHEELNEYIQFLYHESDEIDGAIMGLYESIKETQNLIKLMQDRKEIINSIKSCISDILEEIIGE